MSLKVTLVWPKWASMVLLLCAAIGCASGENSSEPSDDGADFQLGGSIRDGGTMGDAQFAPSPPDGSGSRDGAAGATPDMGMRPPVRIPVPDDLSQVIAEAICDYLARCSYVSIMESLVNEPCLQFMERQFTDLTLARLSPLVDLDQLVYDPQGTRACISAIGTLQCSPDFTALTAACVDSFSGRVSAGDGCTEHEACVGAMYCETQAQCPGQCAPRVALGQACSTTAACETGLTCVRGECVGPAGLGQACGGQGPPCDEGLYCDGENGGAGRCQTLNVQLGGQGAQCAIPNGPFCQDGLACIVQVSGLSARFTCQPRVGEGERCAPGLPDHCQAGLFCNGTDIDGFPPDIEGRCRILPGEGQRCGDAPAFKVCATGLVCDQGNCQSRGRLGDPCGQNETCYSGRCSAGACVVNTLCTP